MVLVFALLTKPFPNIKQKNRTDRNEVWLPKNQLTDVFLFLTEHVRVASI